MANFRKITELQVPGVIGFSPSDWQNQHERFRSLASNPRIGLCMHRLLNNRPEYAYVVVRGIKSLVGDLNKSLVDVIDLVTKSSTSLSHDDKDIRDDTADTRLDTSDGENEKGEEDLSGYGDEPKATDLLKTVDNIINRLGCIASRIIYLSTLKEESPSAEANQAANDRDASSDPATQ
ncbi:hypothetical protein AJ79_05474 [Helicocarpus griseus UAMH5409]|uniref:Uncharacterized protein n=1 Tax=Helicocarpus griseus UAMH5409 TaxID=1447875 RepID=A0A2B7XMM3_9EURO|nr:hypothetical protein AJ79_05474 [Helicocarpus griseus UAMH5409]